MQTPLPLRIAITGVVLIFALLGGYHLWTYYMSDPWTRDARVSAYVVQVAPDVSGPVTQVDVVDNQTVHAGDVLFVIDPSRYQLALDQSNATADARKVQMDQLQRDAMRKKNLRDSAISTSARD